MVIGERIFNVWMSEFPLIFGFEVFTVYIKDCRLTEFSCRDLI